MTTQPTIRFTRSRERGGILLMVMIFAILLMSVAAFLYDNTMAISTNSELSIDSTVLYIAAESALAMAEERVVQDTANGGISHFALSHPYPLDTAVPLKDDQGTVLSELTFGNVTVRNITITRMSLEKEEEVEDTRTASYLLSAEAQIPAPRDPNAVISTRLKRVIALSRSPLFQYMAFYDTDFELTAGANMDITGRIHSNRDIYLAPDGSTMRFKTHYLRSVGKIVRRRKDDDRSTGTVQVVPKSEAVRYGAGHEREGRYIPHSEISNWERMENRHQFEGDFGTNWIDKATDAEGNYDPDPSGFDSNYDDALRDQLADELDLEPEDLPETWKDASQDVWDGTVKSSDHGVTEWTPPDVESKNALQPYDAAEHGTGLQRYNENGVPDANGQFVSAGEFHDMAMAPSSSQQGGGLAIITGQDGITRVWKDGYLCGAMDYKGTLVQTSEHPSLPDAHEQLPQIIQRSYPEDNNGENGERTMFVRREKYGVVQYDGFGDASSFNEGATRSHKGHVPVTDIDMSALSQGALKDPNGDPDDPANRHPSLWPINGLIYASDLRIAPFQEVDVRATDADGNLTSTPTGEKVLKELPNTNTPYSIRLKNGSQLKRYSDAELIADNRRKRGLLFVTQNPVYVQGDFNTGAQEDDSYPRSDTTSDADSRLAYEYGYSDGTLPDGWTPGQRGEGSRGKIPTGIITDALNLLSESWNNGRNSDYQLDSNGEPRTDTDSSYHDAMPTYYNTASICGNQTTGQVDTNDIDGDFDRQEIISKTSSNDRPGYGGGLENLPRFHEKWSSKKCYIRGSFVVLWRSRYARGQWANQRYSPPPRDWNFDQDLLREEVPNSPSGMAATETAQWTE